VRVEVREVLDGLWQIDRLQMPLVGGRDGVCFFVRHVAVNPFTSEEVHGASPLVEELDTAIITLFLSIHS